jgi:hypothetical protein
MPGREKQVAVTAWAVGAVTGVTKVGGGEA